MNTYALGNRVIRFLFRTRALAGILTAVCRIWLRHARWRNHLVEFQFDGVIDGGANIGEFAQTVRDALPHAHLLCIEPHPHASASLRQQGYEVIQAALWHEKSHLSLRQDGPSTSSTVMQADKGVAVAEVEAVRLSDLPIRGNRLLIKLDLQGAELQALAGLGDLEPRCAAFLCEVSLPPGGTSRELNDFFRSRHYVLFASVNELFSGNRQIEADILWIRQDLL